MPSCGGYTFVVGGELLLLKSHLLCGGRNSSIETTIQLVEVVLYAFQQIEGVCRTIHFSYILWEAVFLVLVRGIQRGS